MAMIFITHNLGVVAEIADRVDGDVRRPHRRAGAVVPLLTRPLMPYTRRLLRSVPRLDCFDTDRPPLEAIPGAVPDPAHWPPGCTFDPRCGYAVEGFCDADRPPLDLAGDEHLVRCLRWRDIEGAAAS